jgi:hypothetical protein
MSRFRFPPVYTALPTRFAITRRSQEHCNQLPLHSLHLVRRKTCCVFQVAHSPLPTFGAHSPHVTKLSTCRNLRTLMFTKSWQFLQDTLRIFCRQRSQNFEKKLLASLCLLPVRLSIRMAQLGPHWTDFHEI